MSLIYLARYQVALGNAILLEAALLLHIRENQRHPWLRKVLHHPLVAATPRRVLCGSVRGHLISHRGTKTQKMRLDAIRVIRVIRGSEKLCRHLSRSEQPLGTRDTAKMDAKKLVPPSFQIKGYCPRLLRNLCPHHSK